jgi:hypothetical protein
MASPRTKPPAPAAPKPGSKPGSKPRLRGLAGGSGTAGEEWVCGHRTLPLYVQQEGGGSFRPEFVIWASPSGVLAASPAHPDEVERALLGLLDQALAHPLAGKSRRPSVVHVSDPRLAPALAKALGDGVRIEVGPTPELDTLTAHFLSHLDRAEPAPEREPWVDDGLDPARVRGFFEAAAALYRAAPWKAVPDDSTLFAVDAPALGLRGACASIMGGGGVEFGFLLFDSVADYEAMRQMGVSLAEGESPLGPGVSLSSVSFEPGAAMPKATRAAIARHAWPVAGPKAYPLLLLVDADNVPRPPTPDDLARTHAVCEALARLTRAHRRRLADDLDTPLRATYALETLPGRPEVTLTLPHPDDEAARLRSDEVALGEEIDDWVAAFLRSQAAKRPDDAWLDVAGFVAGSLLEFKASTHRPTFGRWAPIEVEEFLVDYVPRKLTLSSADLDALPAALDAFFAWMGASGRADASTTTAARRVIAELADESKRRALDPANFSMAKAMVTKMLEQGYNPNNAKSLAAFHKKLRADVVAGRETLPDFRMEPLPPPARGASPAHHSGRLRPREPAPRAKQRGAGAKPPPENAPIVFLETLPLPFGRLEPAAKKAPKGSGPAAKKTPKGSGPATKKGKVAVPKATTGVRKTKGGARTTKGTKKGRGGKAPKA